MSFPPPQPGPVFFFSLCRGTLASNLRTKASLLALPMQQFSPLVAQWRSVLKATASLGKHSLGKPGRPQPFQHLKCFHLATAPTMPTLSIRLGQRSSGARAEAPCRVVSDRCQFRLASQLLPPSLKCLCMFAERLLCVSLGMVKCQCSQVEFYLGMTVPVSTSCS